jgi:hypothetical protein
MFKFQKRLSVKTKALKTFSAKTGLRVNRLTQHTQNHFWRIASSNGALSG